MIRASSTHATPLQRVTGGSFGVGEKSVQFEYETEGEKRGSGIERMRVDQSTVEVTENVNREKNRC